jgi:hypothetical protein
VGPQTIPILPSPNFDQTATFYAALGFHEHGRWPEEYLILARPKDGIELHFWFNPGVQPTRNDVACYIRWSRSTEAYALYDEWAAAPLGSGRLREPSKTDYGLLEFALIDPHGNLIRVGGPFTD